MVCPHRRMTAPKPLDCLVVGAGPAGLVAALYLRRFHRDVVLVDAGAPRAAKIPLTRNCPGFPDGIAGVDLLARLRAQLAQAGGTVTPGRVERLRRDGDGFEARAADGTAWHARSVLLATGVVDVEPELPGIDAVRDAGLLRHCPICDGYEATDRAVAVIGRGPHGVRELLFLRHFTPRLWLVALDGDADIDPGVAAALRAKRFGCLRRPAQALRVTPERQVELEMADGARHRFDVVYAALGVRPNAALAQALGARLDERGNVETDARGATAVPGLYAAGDVVSALDQIAVAGGQAAIAATAIHNRLCEQDEG